MKTPGGKAYWFATLARQYLCLQLEYTRTQNKELDPVDPIDSSIIPDWCLHWDLHV